MFCSASLTAVVLVRACKMSDDRCTVFFPVTYRSKFDLYTVLLMIEKLQLINNCILGDGGYPCTSQPTTLITPYQEPVRGAVEARFSGHHAKTRCVIERAFGIMKIFQSSGSLIIVNTCRYVRIYFVHIVYISLISQGSAFLEIQCYYCKQTISIFKMCWDLY